jgi:hypothetical protein
MLLGVTHTLFNEIIHRIIKKISVLSMDYGETIGRPERISLYILLSCAPYNPSLLGCPWATGP